MKAIKKVLSFILALSILSIPAVAQARRHRVRSHNRHYKSGKVVRINSYTRTSKNK